MDINEIIALEDRENQEQKEPAPTVKPRKRINKKIFFIIPLAVLIILGVLAYLFLFKGGTPKVITGHGGGAVFPPVIPEQFINKPSAANILAKPPVKGVSGAPASVDIPVKTKKAKAGSAENTLNDLFTVKYKHKAKKTNILVSPNMPANANVPAIPFNQGLPNFNLKNMAAKIKNMQGMPTGSSFNVSGYSGGYVTVECGKNKKYLKAGQSACGYTLLKADENGATFSRNGKFKKITY